MEEKQSKILQQEDEKISIETIAKNIAETVNFQTAQKKAQRLNFEEVRFYSKLIHYLKKELCIKFSPDVV